MLLFDSRLMRGAYALCAKAVVLLVICLWKVHKSGSATKRAELDEYYKEQLACVSLSLPFPFSHLTCP